MPAAYKLLVEFDSLDELKSYLTPVQAVTQETIDADPDAPAMLKTPAKRGRKPKEETVATQEAVPQVVPYEQVQKATMDFVQAHGKDETKKVLSEFGAKIATELKETDRKSYIDKLTTRSQELGKEELA